MLLNFLILFFISNSFSLDSSKLWSEDSVVKIEDASIYKIQNAFIELAQKLNPAVVNIFSTQNISSPQLPDDVLRLFENFYGRSFRNQMAPRKAIALGSGFIINEDGYILTNNHVIKDADEIKVKLYDEVEYQAKVLGYDPETDIALIKIDANKKLPFASLGNSSELKIGSWVVAIGNPYGHNHTVTQGIVSAKGRVLPEVSVYNDFIQTDASINQGNSGGPLIDITGKVVGINTAIDPRGQGLGFSIPIDEAKKIIPSLVKGKTVIHDSGWLGVGLETLTPSLNSYLNLNQHQRGVVISEVQKNSPADIAGLKSYDVLLKFNKKVITNSQDLAFLVKRTAAGVKVPVEIIREGKKQIKNVTIGSLEKVSSKNKTPKLVSDNSFGMELENLNKETIDKYRLKNLQEFEGVLVTQVEYGTPASKAGIATEDIIVEVNKIKVKNTSDYSEAIKSNKKNEHLLKIKRNDKYFFTLLKV